jgi:hypothetical protein
MMTVVLEELITVRDAGGYFDLGSATFNMTRIVTGQPTPTSTSGSRHPAVARGRLPPGR